MEYIRVWLLIRKGGGKEYEQLTSHMLDKGEDEDIDEDEEDVDDEDEDEYEDDEDEDEDE